MTLESLAKYTEDSIDSCKELLNFLKKKSAMDAEYAKGLVKLCQTTSGAFSKSKAGEKDLLLKSSLWTSFVDIVQMIHDEASTMRSVAINLGNDITNPIQVYIKDMELERKNILDEGSKQTKLLQDMYTELKKVKQNHDNIMQSTNDAKEAMLKAQRSPNVKEKDLEKLQQKVDTCTENLKSAETAFRDQDEGCKGAQLIYWQTTMPHLLQRLYDKEEERCVAIHNLIRNWCLMEKQRVDYDAASCDKKLDKIEGCDLSGDFEHVFQDHMNSSADAGDDAKGSALPSISVHSLVNPLKAGRLMLKMDEHDSVWKARYFVLMGDRTDPTNAAYLPTSGRLYYFEQEDSLKPNGIIDLSGASVYSADDTIARGEKRNLFLVSTSLTTTENNQLVTKSKVLYMSADSDNDKDDWINVLKRYALCCTPCISIALSEPVSLNLDQVDQVAAQFPRASPKEVYYRNVKSLTLWIMEARDLHALEPNAKNPNSEGPSVPSHEVLFNALQMQKSYTPYCTVSVNDARIAKTSIKSTANPFYGEEFHFDELTECEKEIRIEVFNSGRRKNSALGFIDIKLAQFEDAQSANHVHKKYEAWLPLQSYIGLEEFDTVDRDGNPAIRVAATLTQETVLPLYEYPSFLNCLFENEFRVLKSLARSAEKCTSFARDDFARSLVNVLVATESDTTAFRALLSVDIEGTEDPNILFRGNSMATKALDQHMKHVGSEYLKDVLSAPIKLVYERSSRQESCEIDVTRMERNDEETIKKHQKRLLNWAQIFWDAIQHSADRCPRHIRETLQSIREMVVSSFSDRKQGSEKEAANLGNVQYSAVSGFIFLRFFCPAILNPKLFGLWPELSENPIASRTLTLVAKIIQNLANLSDFKGKEPHMEFCNPWILFNMDAMKTCIVHFSNTALAEQSVRRGTVLQEHIYPVDLSRQFNLLYLQLLNNIPELKNLCEEVRAAEKQGTESSLSAMRQRLEPEALERLFAYQVVLQSHYQKYDDVFKKNRVAVESCAHIQKPFNIMRMTSNAMAGGARGAGPKPRKGHSSLKTKLISTPTLVGSSNERRLSTILPASDDESVKSDFNTRSNSMSLRMVSEEANNQGAPLVKASRQSNDKVKFDEDIPNLPEVIPQSPLDMNDYSKTASFEHLPDVSVVKQEQYSTKAKQSTGSVDNLTSEDKKDSRKSSHFGGKFVQRLLTGGSIRGNVNMSDDQNLVEQSEDGGQAKKSKGGQSVMSKLSFGGTISNQRSPSIRISSPILQPQPAPQQQKNDSGNGDDRA